jgi:hypothetical protein
MNTPTAFTGANLAQLDELSADYTKTGAALRAKSELLMGRISAAIDDYNTTSSQLLSQTQQLTGQIELEMSEVSGHAAGVEWTGNNRVGFDADLQSFGASVRNGSEVIRSDVSALKDQIATRFNPALEEFGQSLNKRVDRVDASAVETSQAVARQREMLDSAANTGWTA